MAVNNKSIIPLEVRGAINSILNGDSKWKYWYPWLENLRNTNTFVHLSAGWQNKKWPQDPDPGFDYYVLSGDTGMWGWGEHVSELYDRPVYVIALPEVYQKSSNQAVTYIPNIYYHRQILKLLEFDPHVPPKNIQYRASALTSRVTQSKVIVFSAILQFLKDNLVSLSDWVEEDNVHHWRSTGNQCLDQLTDYFRSNWAGSSLKIFNDSMDPFSLTVPAYTQSAINFTQESFHYSLMYDETKDREYILPGPFLTEKTFKCLLSQTAFVPVGQFRSYRWLENMGMRFEYDLDLGFDDDPGNITRLHGLVKFIQNLSQYTAQELFEMTRESSQHNRSIIVSGEFFDNCEKINQSSLTVLSEHILA